MLESVVEGTPVVGPPLDVGEPVGVVDTPGAGDVLVADVWVGEGAVSDVEGAGVGLEDAVPDGVEDRDVDGLTEGDGRGRGRGKGSPAGVPGSTGGSVGACVGLTLGVPGEVGTTGTRMLPTPSAYRRSSCKTIAM